MNITGKQWLAIVVAVLSVLAVSTAQLQDIVGPTLAKTIVSIAALANTVLASVLAVVNSQASLVTDVRAMPGVEKIEVNERANKTLANLAVDDTEEKIVVKPGAEATVNHTASS